jgi:hypothetical protein
MLCKLRETISENISTLEKVSGADYGFLFLTLIKSVDPSI